MIDTIFGISASGERIPIDCEKLVLVSNDNVELEITFGGTHDTDLTLHAISDCQNKQFRQLTLYPGASNLVSIKLSTHTA